MSKVMPHKIKIKADKVHAGALDDTAVKSAVEEGTVIAIGADVSLPLKVGDRIRYKSWGCDLFNDNGQTLIFVDERTLAICEKI